MSEQLIEKKIGRRTFGFRTSMDERQLARVDALLVPRSESGSATLGGRTSVVAAEVEGLGRVVVKHFMRGGVMRLVNQRHYLRWGAGRSAQEFALLEKVRKLGVNAPEPLAYVVEGGMIYKAWLVTREIADHRSMIAIAEREEEKLLGLMDNLATQVDILIRNRIFHVDLHPGNVLVDSNNRVFLIDFDKAQYFGGNLNKLRDQYLWRWRRAVIKHQLPETLAEIMCLKLRTHYE